MKPIKLVMSAFGSYAGEEVLDFRDRNRGVFLITGDTGAGKTTIFDAITYALYDQTSGGLREGDMMRSQYAEPETPTFVEFTFSCGKEEYRVRRNPNYRRQSKRKNKEGTYAMTKESASAALWLPDGQEFPGKIREINEKIVEILGLGASQFTQTAMIAQGEFLRLLHASSRERKEIFARIFDTGVYAALQMKLRERSKCLYGQLEDNRKLCDHEIQGVRYLPDSTAGNLWEESRGLLETNPEQILESLDALIRELEAGETEVRSREETLRKELEENAWKLRQAREINQLFQRIEEAEGEIARGRKEVRQQKEQEQKKIVELQESTCRYERRMPELSEQIAGWRSYLPKYALLKEKQQAAAQAQKHQKQVESNCRQVQQQLETVIVSQEQAQKQQQILEETAVNLPLLEEQVKSLADRQSLLEEMSETLKRLNHQERKREEQRRKTETSLQIFQEKSREYEEKNQRFIREQVGMIAETLREGEPCPVCGSRIHPQKAKLSEGAVTRRQVEQAKKEREQADQDLNLCREVFQKVQETCEKEKYRLEQDGARMFGGAFHPEMIPSALTDCREKAEQTKARLKEGKMQEKKLQQLKERQQQLQQEKERLEQEKEAFTQKQYEAKLAFETAAQAGQSLLEELPFSSERELKQHLEQVEQEKAGLEREKSQAEKSLQKLQQELARNQGILTEQQKNLEQLKQQSEGKEPVDTAPVLEREQQLKKQAQKLEQEKLQLVSFISRNSQARQQLEKLEHQRKSLKEQYELVSNLDKTANGNLARHIRMDFQTYVQRRYFHSIIREANRRLVKINGSQFILRCRELENLGRQGEAGLDLDVYDLVTDRVRDVKTLSGGESFLAALSMALGMADVIRNTAGRVHLDTMFIDEGFGSLDEEARRRAIGILNELAGDTRLVGIISHVTELKEQMERKLVISKSQKGSHARWVPDGQTYFR